MSAFWCPLLAARTYFTAPCLRLAQGRQTLPVVHAEPSAHRGHSPPPQSVAVSVPSLIPLVQVATEGMGVGSAVGAGLNVGKRLGVELVGGRLGAAVGVSVGVAEGGRDARDTASESMLE